LFVVRPHRRDVIRVLALTGKSFFTEGLFCLLCVPTGGMLFEYPALTGKSFFAEGLFCLLYVPTGGMLFEYPALTGKSFFAEGLFCLLCVPTGGMLFESPRAHRKVLLYRRVFLFVVRPHRRDVIRVLALTGKSFFAEGLFCLLCVPAFKSPHRWL